MAKIIHLDHDHDAENPATAFDGQWTLYSFNRRHRSFKDPAYFFPNGKPTLGLRSKLKAGTAFVLSYFEHSTCVWSRQGQGPQCRWDNVQVAGVLVWENPLKDLGPSSLEARQKDADAFLATYTAWANGEVYTFAVEDEKGEILDSCGGFYGNDLKTLAEYIRDALAGDTEFTFKGDASDLGPYLDIAPVEKVDT